MQRNYFQRIPHIVAKRLATQTLGNLLFFDTETRDSLKGKDVFLQRHKIWFGYAIAWRIDHGKRTKDIKFRFTTSDQFFTFLESRLVDKKPLYVFAHNLPFDLTIVDFWHQVSLRKITVDYFVADDPPCIFRCTWKKKQIIFIDTLNFWRTSLAKLGEAIGIPKIEMPKSTKNVKEWNTYCINDCRVISEAIYHLMCFIEEHDLGAIGFTAPSFAMNAYKKRFMKHDIYIHDNLAAIKLERESYYGGRVQCFQIGKGSDQTYYYLDVNSLYPAMMRYSFPTKLMGVINEMDISSARQIIKRYGTIARCYINSPNESFPKRYNDRLCFVTGKFNTTLCGPELQRAIDGGYIRFIYSLSYYDVKPIFSEFVSFFWKLRQNYKLQGNQVYSDFAKLLMNSLYGKWGQNGVSWTKLTLDSFREYLTRAMKTELISKYDYKALIHEVITTTKWIIQGLDTPINVRRLGNHVQLRFPIMEHWESFPAISSYVTAYAREFLFELINCADEKNCYYCDTDSLFVNKQGYDKLKRAGHISETELGKLKLVETTNKLTIFGPKDYLFGSKIVRKGIRANAIQTGIHTFQQLQFEGLRSIIKRGGESYIDIKTISKENKRQFNKGTIGNRGRVILYNLNQTMLKDYTILS